MTFLLTQAQQEQVSLTRPFRLAAITVTYNVQCSFPTHEPPLQHVLLLTPFATTASASGCELVRTFLPASSCLFERHFGECGRELPVRAIWIDMPIRQPPPKLAIVNTTGRHLNLETRWNAVRVYHYTMKNAFQILSGFLRSEKMGRLPAQACATYNELVLFRPVYTRSGVLLPSPRSH
jgi:hypothetical protein